MADVEVQGFVAVPGPAGEAAVPDVPDVDVNPQSVDDEPSDETEGACDDGQEGNDAAAAGDATTLEDDATPQDEVPVVNKPERLYFIRRPKPDLSDLEIDIEKMRSQFNNLKDGCDILLASLKVQRVHQDEAKRSFESAHEVFKQSKEEQQRWRAELEPFREANKAVADRRSKLRDELRDLPARSEVELDQMLEQIEFDLSHVTMSRHEENKLIEQMKRLEKARPKVRQAQSEVEAVDSTHDQLVDFKASKQELEKKLDMIRDEVSEAKAIMDARFEVHREIREKTKQLSDEFNSMRAQKDEKWAELNRLRDARKEKLDEFYANRRFSQQVRTLIVEGKLDQAQQECAQLADSAIQQFTSDKAAWLEYVGLWDLQRKYAVSQADIDLESGAPVAKKAAPAANAKPESGASRAKEIIKALMLEADVELGKAPKPSAAAASHNTSILTPSAAANGATGTAAAPKDAAAPKAAAPKPAQKAKKAPAAPPVVEIDDTFVPPPKAEADAPKLTKAQEKEKLRAEQRAKAAEAEERKRKLEERKQKKAEKAAEVAKLREAELEAKRIADQRRVEREAEEQRRQSALRKERAAAQAEKRAKGKAAGSGRSAPVVRARPVKLSPIDKLQKWVRDNGPLVAVVGVVVFLSALAMMMVSMS